MKKTSLSLLFWLSTFAALIIMIMSAGWLLITIGLVLIPIIILHIRAATRGLKRAPYLGIWILVSSFTFLAFAFARTDFDDVNEYTGLSTLMNFFDSKNLMYLHSTSYYFLPAVVFILLTVAIDIFVLVKSRRPPPVPVNKDFV
jgi:hypothetical protein